MSRLGNTRQKFLVFLAAACLVFVTGFGYKPEDKIKVTVNYVDEYNKLTRPENYDPNQNAVPYYEQAFEELTDAPNDITELRKAWPGDMDKDDFNTVKNWVNSNSKALEYLSMASKKPYYWPKQDIEQHFSEVLMPDLAQYRKSCFCMVLNTKFLVLQDNNDKAVQSLIETYKIGSHLCGRKMLITQLVGIAVRALVVQTSFQIIDRTEQNPEFLKYLQEQLENILSKRPCTIDFSAEKLYYYDCAQRLFTDDGDGDGHFYGTKLFEDRTYAEKIAWVEIIKEQWKSLKKLTRKRAIQQADDVYDKLNILARKTPFQVYKENSNPEENLNRIAKNDPLLQILMPAVIKVIDISYRATVDTEALITTLAILRYKADKGNYPESLQQLLSTGYIKEIPIDPFSGSELAYKLTEGNFILYSFSEDCDDDGGTHVGWGKYDEGGDYVFWPIQQEKE